MPPPLPSVLYEHAQGYAVQNFSYKLGSGFGASTKLLSFGSGSFSFATANGVKAIDTDIATNFNFMLLTCLRNDVFIIHNMNTYTILKK